ncbi:synergin gamma-like [Ornithodoros turicata]|uniref:synergin gamma-like n=1 Tax=Ornithodoros turicata TaxID=34597 RepID=UPI00313A1367
MANRKDPKESLSALEKKLMTNLFENGKASVFSKPLTSQKSFTPKCAPSSNSTQVQHMHKLPRFPAWCHCAYVPAHYRNIEKLVSGPGGIDGQCVSSLLLSSGLPNPVLGKIWELCSRTISGSFTQQELYAALALVAVVQAGYPPALEVLFQLPQPPLPAFLQQQPISSTTVSPAHCTPDTTTTWRHYPVPPNMHPPPVSLPQDPQRATLTQASTFGGPQKNTTRHPAAFVPSATACQSSTSLVDTPSSTTKVETSYPQPQFADAPPRPAVWCSEVTKPDPACGVQPVRLDTSVLMPSVSGQGSSLASQDSKIGNFDDFADDFDDFMSATTTATTSTTNDSKDPFETGNFVTDPREAGDFGGSLPDTKGGTNVVMPSGDSLAIDFKGLGVAPTESNSLSALTNLDVKCVSSKKPRSSLPKTGKLTVKNMANSKPFQFKIDISAITSKKIDTTKPSEAKVNDAEKAGVPEDFCDFPGGAVPPPVEDDFADFQQAFPDTRVAEDEGVAKCTEDRYSVFKELANDTMIQWSEPAGEDKDKDDWPAGANSDASQTGAVTVQGGLFAETDDNDEDFGDFCHVIVPPPVSPAQSTPMRSTEEPDFFEISSHTPEQVRRSNPSQDTLSLGDRLSVYSLELGGRNGSSPSHHGSVLSLEFRMGNSDGTDDDESPRMGSDDGGGVSASADETASVDIPSDTLEETSHFQACQPALVLDKYSFIREVNQQPTEEGDCVDKWICCLRGILEIIQRANSFFGRESSSQVCREALETEEGANYVKNITEVYKVCQRIKLSSKLTGKQSETLEKLCLDIQSIWEDVASFLENSCLFSIPVLPEVDTKWMPNLDDSSKACGICLLHVDNPEMMTSKLTYGARQYHAPCANLWVNCINSLLPAIPYPDLL